MFLNTQGRVLKRLDTLSKLIASFFPQWNTLLNDQNTNSNRLRKFRVTMTKVETGLLLSELGGD
jgi:hypothetical protein